MALGVIVMLVMASGCRLPVDVNLDQAPDLKLIVVRSDGQTAFPGVKCEILDPPNNSTTNSAGEATLMVYTDHNRVTVTFTFWQRTPNGTRQQTAVRAFGLHRGANHHKVALPDIAIQ